jgi:hypothetical protein
MLNLLFIEAVKFTERIQQLRAEQNLTELEELLSEDATLGDVIR